MAFRDYYVAAVDALYEAIKAEVKLDPTQTDAVRYINQLYKSNWIPGSKLPTVHCYIPSKANEEHLGIGYGPFTTMQGRVTLYCELHGDWTSKMLADMGYESINTPDDLWRAMYFITDKIEEVLRREVNYRLSDFGSNDVMIVRPNGTFFNSMQLDDKVLAIAHVNIMYQQRQVDV